MKLYEYQGKELFAGAGIPVPRAKRADSMAELDAALDAVGLPCVLKAQMLQGGRGKAGLIQTAESRDDAREKAQRIFDAPQKVKAVLVEEKLISPRMLVNPLRPKRKPAYVYIKPSAPSGKVPGGRLMVYEVYDKWPVQLHVFFVDGHVQCIQNEAEFHRRLREAGVKPTTTPAAAGR